MVGDLRWTHHSKALGLLTQEMTTRGTNKSTGGQQVVISKNTAFLCRKIGIFLKYKGVSYPRESHRVHN